MRAVIRLLLSMRTAFALLLICMLLFLAGSVALPRDLAFYSGIDDTPLFKWLRTTASPGHTWWIYALIACMSALSLSTVACTVEALLSPGMRRNPAAKLPTQLMHMGVLFVMLGHLLTAWLGTREDITFKAGQAHVLAPGLDIRLAEVRAKKDAAGYDIDWEAELLVEDSGAAPERRTLKPAHPVRARGMGLYIKSISTEGGQSALVKVVRDPGAIWALVGGLLVSAGGIGFVLTRRGPQARPLD